MWLFELFFPQFWKSYMSRYGYLEEFQRVPWNSRSRESTVFGVVLKLWPRQNPVHGRAWAIADIGFVQRIWLHCCRMVYVKISPYYITVKFIFEPAHDKTYKIWHVRPEKIRSVWESAQSDQSIRYSLDGQLRTQAFVMWTAKTLIRLGGRPGWSIFAGRTCHFVGFVMRWLKLFSLRL